MSEKLILFFNKLEKDSESPLPSEFHSEVIELISDKFNSEYVSELPITDMEFTAAVAYGANKYNRVVYQNQCYWIL